MGVPRRRDRQRAESQDGVVFLAFLPQFVVPARGSVSGQFLLLGMAFVAIAFCMDTSWCLLASTARTWLRRHPRAVASGAMSPGV
jgi:threonine/homoserine/homoserine lactone efflux protein